MDDKDPSLSQAQTKRFQCQHPGGCPERWNIPDGHRLCVLHDSCITNSYFTPEDCVICSAHILELLETPAEFMLKKRKHYHLMARWIKARGQNSKIKWRDPQLALTLMIDPPSKGYTGDVQADLEAIMKGDKCFINVGSQHEKNFSSGEGTTKNDSEESRPKIPIYLRLGPQSPNINNESKPLVPLSERLGRDRGSVIERLDGGHGEWSERGRGRGEPYERGTRGRGTSMDHGSRGRGDWSVRGSRDQWSERGGRGRGEWSERGSRGRGDWSERGGRGRGEWSERGGRGRGEWSERGGRGRGDWSERGGRGRGDWSERGGRGRGDWSERGGRGRGDWSERGGRGRGEWSERGGRGRGDWSERGGRGRGDWSERGGRGRGDWSECGGSGRGDWVDHNSRGRGEWSERGNRGRGQWSEWGISNRGQGFIRGTRGRGYDPSYRSRGRGFARGNRGRGQWSEHRNDNSEEFDNLQGYENFDESGEYYEGKYHEKDLYEVEEVFELELHQERDHIDKVESHSKERPRDREDVKVYIDNNDFSDHHSSKHREYLQHNHRKHDEFRHEKRHDELRHKEFRHEDLRHDEFRHEKRHKELRHDEFLHEKRPRIESRHDEIQRDSHHSSRSRDEFRPSTRSHDEFQHSSRAREEYRHRSRSHEEFQREERSHKERSHKEVRHEERPRKEIRHEDRPRKEFRHEERPHKDLRYKEKHEFRHSSRSQDEYRREEKLHKELRHKERPELRPSSRLYDERSSVEFRRKERPEIRHSSSSRDEFRRKEKLPKETRREDRPHSHNRRISQDQEPRHLDNVEKGSRRSARDELRSFLAGIPKEDIGSDNGHGREGRRVTEHEDNRVDVKLPSNAGSVWGDMIISAKRGKNRQNWEEPNTVSEVKRKPQRPDKYREVREELREHVHKRDHVTHRRPAVHSSPRREVVVAACEDEKYQTHKTSRQWSQREGDRNDYWSNREKDGTRGSTKREVDIVGFSDSLSDHYTPQAKRKKTDYSVVDDSFNSSSRMVSVGPQAQPRTTSTHTVNDRYDQAPKAFPPPMRTTWEDNPPEFERGAEVDCWSASTQSNNNIDPQGCAASHILAARNAMNSIRSEKSNPLQSQQPMSYEAFMNYFKGSVSSEKSINQYIEYKLEFKKLQFNQLSNDLEEKRYSVPLQPPEIYPGPSSSGSGSMGRSVTQDPSHNYRPGSLSTKTNSWPYSQTQPMQHFPPPQHKADSYRIVH